MLLSGMNFISPENILMRGISHQLFLSYIPKDKKKNADKTAFFFDIYSAWFLFLREVKILSVAVHELRQ